MADPDPLLIFVLVVGTYGIIEYLQNGDRSWLGYYLLGGRKRLQQQGLAK